jgi:hypothetical protein
MEEFYKDMVGRGSICDQESLEPEFIDSDFDINKNLTNALHVIWREINPSSSLLSTLKQTQADAKLRNICHRLMH